MTQITEVTQINKAEFIAQLAEYRKSLVKVQEDGTEVALRKNTTKKDAGEYTEDILDLLVQLAGQGVGVTFPAVFETKVVPTEARTARNPQNGESVQVPAGHKLTIKAKKHLKEAVNPSEVVEA